MYVVFTLAGDFHLNFSPLTQELETQSPRYFLVHYVILKCQIPWGFFVQLHGNCSVPSCQLKAAGAGTKVTCCRTRGVPMQGRCACWALGVSMAGGQLGVAPPTANYHVWKITNTCSGISVYPHSWCLDGSSMRPAISVPAWKCHRSWNLRPFPVFPLWQPGFANGSVRSILSLMRL